MRWNLHPIDPPPYWNRVYVLSLDCKVEVHCVSSLLSRKRSVNRDLYQDCVYGKKGPETNFWNLLRWGSTLSRVLPSTRTLTGKREKWKRGGPRRVILTLGTFEPSGTRGTVDQKYSHFPREQLGMTSHLLRKRKRICSRFVEHNL